jgi:hypothetical protein
LESLESKIGYWSNFRSMAVNKLIREFLTDTTLINQQDSLINLLQNETSLESKYRLAFAFLENNQTEEALETLNEIPAIGLTSEDLETNNQYLDYFEILKVMIDSSLNPRQLDSSSVQSLYLIMNSNLPLISSYARGLLLKGRFMEFTEHVSFPSIVKSYPAYYDLDPQKPDFLKDDKLILFPNPSGDYVIAYFNSLGFDECGSIKIDNLQGKDLEIIRLDSRQNQVVIDLSAFSNGLYIVSLIVNDKLIETEKLVKGRD